MRHYTHVLQSHIQTIHCPVVIHLELPGFAPRFGGNVERRHHILGGNVFLVDISTRVVDAVIHKPLNDRQLAAVERNAGRAPDKLRKRIRQQRLTHGTQRGGIARDGTDRRPRFGVEFIVAQHVAHHRLFGVARIEHFVANPTHIVFVQVGVIPHNRKLVIQFVVVDILL